MPATLLCARCGGSERPLARGDKSTTARRWRQIKAPLDHSGGARPRSLGLPPEKGTRYYFNEVLTESNLPLRLVPNPFTTAMIAIEIPAAIKPYSIAVAPD